MRIVVVFANGKLKYEEMYYAPKGSSDDDIYGAVEKIVTNYNNYLRPNETSISIIDVFEEKGSDDFLYSIARHDWEKSNLVTIISRGSSYDTYRCKKCGATGKRHGLSSDIDVDKKKYKNCNKI